MDCGCRVQTRFGLLSIVNSEREHANDLLWRLSGCLTRHLRVNLTDRMSKRSESAYLDLLQSLVESLLVAGDDRNVCTAFGEQNSEAKA
jgi:carboxypeptidase C (cathepsin A)